MISTRALLAQSSSTVEASLQPKWVVASAVIILVSVTLRRSCVRPGGLFHRWVKDSIRNKSDSRNNSNTISNRNKGLLQYSGFCVFLMASAVFLVFYYFGPPHSELPGYYAAVMAALIVLANGLDECVQKWETKKEDVLDFRQQLRQSLLKDTLEKQKQEESDSSESYHGEKDMEKCG